MVEGNDATAVRVLERAGGLDIAGSQTSILTADHYVGYWASSILSLPLGGRGGKETATEGPVHPGVLCVTVQALTVVLEN